MSKLFDFTQIDLSGTPAVVVNITGSGFDHEVTGVLESFTQEYAKYVNVNEIHNYETAEVLVEAFGEFQQDKGLVYNSAEEDEEEEFDVVAMISSVQIIVTGSKHTLVLNIVSSFDNGEDDEDDAEDDFE